MKTKAALVLAAITLAQVPAKAGIIADGVELVTDLSTEISAGALAVLGITVIFIGLRFAKKLMNRAS